MPDQDRSVEAGDRVGVVIGGGHLLLNELVRDHLEADGRFLVHAHKSVSADQFVLQVRGIAAVRRVGLLVDPPGSQGWEDAADKLRGADSHFGLVVLTARPNFGKQRRWQQRLGKSNLNRANGLITFDSRSDDLCDAIIEAAKRPAARSAFWLDGPRHPQAFFRGEEGKGARKVHGNQRRHQILALEALGKSRRKIADLMDIKEDQVKVNLNTAMKNLGARSEVELGRLAVESGLLDDLEDFGDLEESP